MENKELLNEWTKEIRPISNPSRKSVKTMKKKNN